MPNSQEGVNVLFGSTMSSDDQDLEEHLDMGEDLLEETDENLSTLRQDLDNIANLQAELLTMETDDDEHGSGCSELLSPKRDIRHDDVVMDDDVVEVEIETERQSSPDEIIPDIKEQVKLVSSVPSTLKAIAPKPNVATPRTGTKANIITAGGQQIVLIQSPGGTANAVSLSTGQPIKLVSQTGQPVSLPQFHTSRQQLVKTVDGNIILRTAMPKTTPAPGNLLKTMANVKRVISTPSVQKKVLVTNTGTQIPKTEPGTQMMKIITSSSASTIGSPNKTITLAQAQEMGLLTPSQIQQLLPQATGKQLIINKGQPKTQLIKLTSSQLPKSPTKILPAPKFVQKQAAHKVIIKQGHGKGLLGSGQQVIRIPTGQLNSTSGQIHQINVPGQGIQYVRLLNTSTSNTSTVSTSGMVTGTSSLVRTTPAGQSQGQGKLQTIVPVALLNRPTTTATSHQSIVKVVPISSASQISTAPIRPVVPKTTTSMSGSQRIIAPTSGSSHGKITTVPASALNQIQGTTILPTSPGNSIVMLPTQFVQLQQEMARVNVAKTIPKVEPTIKLANDTSPESAQRGSSSSSLEPNGLRPRKPCNCTKSQCLKLYCDCFANGEFCHMCNCVNCFNNLDNEEERQKAIRSCLERNPSAFRPKIGKGRDTGENAVRKHTKGCNCKRSGCLKNYCECYEAKIACSNNCKCVGCRNIEDSLEKKSLRPIAPLITLGDTSSNLSHLGSKILSANHKTPVSALVQNKNRSMGSTIPTDIINYRPMLGTNKKAFAFMTTEVIEATVQCLLASAEQAENKELEFEEAERQVLAEFGRCLVEIIETARI